MFDSLPRGAKRGANGIGQTGGRPAVPPRGAHSPVSLSVRATLASRRSPTRCHGPCAGCGVGWRADQPLMLLDGPCRVAGVISSADGPLDLRLEPPLTAGGSARL